MGAYTHLRHTPVEFTILHITFAKLPGDLRPGELDTQIEGMRAIVREAQVRKQFERIGRRAQSVAIVDMQAVGADLYAKARILYFARGRGDLFGTPAKRVERVQRQECFAESLRQVAGFAGRIHYAAGPVGLANDARSMRTDLGRQDVG